MKKVGVILLLLTFCTISIVNLSNLLETNQRHEYNHEISEEVLDLKRNNTSKPNIGKISWTGDVSRADYPCFPSKFDPSPEMYDNNNVTIVFLKVAWKDMHSETFYSYIHELCSCDANKPAIWTLRRTDVVPHFYVGPGKFVSRSLGSILSAYNETACGPILVGDPPAEPALTVHTTVYKEHLMRRSYGYHDKLNDPRHILMCHNAADDYEDATSVYFVTPRHARNVVPKFFPPVMVERSKEVMERERRRGRPPVFLVLGSLDTLLRKRNFLGMLPVLQQHARETFTMRLLGSSDKGPDAPIEQMIPMLGALPEVLTRKINVVANADPYEFMLHVGKADVVLPLVNETNAARYYEGMKKLTSSVTWGLGFRKRMVIYRPLGELFGMKEDNETYWMYENSGHFYSVFARCLEYHLREWEERVSALN